MKMTLSVTIIVTYEPLIPTPPQEYRLIIYISACKKVLYFSLGHVPILKGITVVEGREDRIVFVEL